MFGKVLLRNICLRCLRTNNYCEGLTAGAADPVRNEQQETWYGCVWDGGRGEKEEKVGEGGILVLLMALLVPLVLAMLPFLVLLLVRRLVLVLFGLLVWLLGLLILLLVRSLRVPPIRGARVPVEMDDDDDDDDDEDEDEDDLPPPRYFTRLSKR